MASTNPWVAFRGLLPTPARTIVTITANNGNGTSTATLRTGQTVIVNGEQITAGNRAWVEDGRVIGPASSLSYSEVFV